LAALLERRLHAVVQIEVEQDDQIQRVLPRFDLHGRGLVLRDELVVAGPDGCDQRARVLLQATQPHVAPHQVQVDPGRLVVA